MRLNAPKKHSRISKVLSVVLCGVFLGVAAPLHTAKVHAQFGGVTIEGPGPLLTAAVIGSGAEAAQATGAAPINALNALAWTVAKMTVQSITRSTVNWINTGFEGSPAFVSDLRENLSYLGDAVAEDFLNNLNKTVVDTTGFNIKSPFQDQLNQQLRQEFYRTTASYGVNQFYTLNKTTDDPKAFLNGDFSKGGFDAFFSANKNPANNPFGAYKLASNQLWAQIDSAAKAREAELGWSKGFLPWRGNCGQTSGTAVSLSKTDKCLFSPVKTPGAIIEKQLEDTLGSGIRQLELADSINEIVAALIGQMVNQVLGPGGVAGLSQPAQGGGLSYVTQATDPSQYQTSSGSIANGVIQNIQNNLTAYTAYRDNWQRIADAASQAQNACGVLTSTRATSVMVTATGNVAMGNTAIQKTNTILAEVQSAAQSTAVNASTGITQAIADYQSYLSSIDLPSPTDLNIAATESNEAGEGTTTLYSEMKELAASCRAGNI